MILLRNHRNIGIALCLGLTLCFMVSPALAQEAKIQGFPKAEKLFTEIIALLVVTTVLESALATIFQWRVYQMLFNARAVKSIVMVVVGWGVVTLFDYDIFARILSLAGVGPAETDPKVLSVRKSDAFSIAMSALVLAGGSAGINTLLKRLGFRSPIQDEAAPVLKEDEAWISVTVLRKRAVGSVQIHLDEIAAAPEDAPALLGVVDDRWAITKVLEMIFAVPGRVPSYGGRKVKVGQAYRIVATGFRKPEGAAPGESERFREEIYAGRFASRAVIDLVATV